MGLLTQGPGVFFLVAAFVLLVIVSCSVPVAKWSYFLDASVGGISLKLGNWGYCISQSGRYTCTGSHLGYDAPAAVNVLGSTGDISSAVIHGLTYALILHPIAAAITLIAIIVSLTNNIVLDVIGSLVSFFAFLVCLVALIIDSVLFVTARHRINDAVPGSPASLGSAFWMVIAATILLLLAAFTVCFGSARARRERRDRRALDTAYPAQNAPVMTQKRRFWQRNQAY